MPYRVLRSAACRLRDEMEAEPMCVRGWAGRCLRGQTGSLRGCGGEKTNDLGLPE